LAEHHERAINAPWPAMVLVGSILVANAFQQWIGADSLILRFGFSPADLAHGRLAPLVLALFLHAGWAHALANCAFALAFGAPTSRRMGEDAKGAAAFFVFYLVCGVLANLIYAQIHPRDINVVVGASGAVAGLMGATSRLMGPGPGLAPLISRPVIGMALAWTLVNVVFGAWFVGLTPGSDGAPIAWEVHLAGYAVGLFLFSPVLSLLGRRDFDHGIGN
jgi:membrane associated rhomboid family serine protease